MQLDNLDWRILAALQDNGRLSNQDLAARVAVSPATCLRRVKRLVEAGVIERRVAVLSPAHLGAGLQALRALEPALQSLCSERDHYPVLLRAEFERLHHRQRELIAALIPITSPRVLMSGPPLLPG
mgnify:CR=1 FL=1